MSERAGDILVADMLHAVERIASERLNVTDHARTQRGIRQASLRRAHVAIYPPDQLLL